MPTPEDWRFINTFAPWLSAVGTISAVVVSLYLSTRDKPKLKITNSIQLLITPGLDEVPRYLMIKVANIGIRPTKVVAVGWKEGLFFKKSYIQNLSGRYDEETSASAYANMYSSELPVVLNDGEEAQWFIPLDREDNWIDSWIKDNLGWCPRWNLWFTNLEVYTSHDMKFKTRIGKTVREEILETIEKNKKKETAKD